MSKRSKRTPGLETAHPFAGLRPVADGYIRHPHAAGVDIGATEIVACVPGDATTQLVRAFGTYTINLHALSQWFRAQGITTVALARVVYRMLKDKVEYEPLSVGEDEKRYEAQQLKDLQKKAAVGNCVSALGYQIVPG